MALMPVSWELNSNAQPYIHFLPCPCWWQVAYRGQDYGCCYLPQRDHGHKGWSNPCKPTPNRLSPPTLPQMFRQKIIKKGACNLSKKP
jgi:hypothetical protein